MTVKPFGSSLSFSEITNEFGTPPGKNLGAYRVSQTVSGLTNLALDNEVNSAGIVTALMPQSGQIKFSDFYSKKLNVVVDYTVVAGSTVTKVIGRNDYELNNGLGSKGRTVVIGNFKSRPSSPVGTKAWIHTNGNVGSDIKTPTREYASLLTGTWETTTDLRVDVGPSGFVVGAGGDGGAGGIARNRTLEPGFPGNTGTSAIGINAVSSSIIVTNRGRIQGGGGGGGGGGGAYGRHRYQVGLDRRTRLVDVGGSGGGGGSGYPLGKGGAGGIGLATGNDDNNSLNGVPGMDATDPLNGGKGGDSQADTVYQGVAVGGAGGGGAINGSGGTGTTISRGGATATTLNGSNGTATSGGAGSAGAGDGRGRRGSGGAGAAGGSGGLNGYAIIVSNNGSGVTITGNTPIGSIQYNTTPQ